MVFHHFDDREQAVRECQRVLRRDGSVCLRAGTTDRISQTPDLPFFPRSDAILHNTFHSQAAIEAIFNDAGFRLVGHELICSSLALSRMRGPEPSQRLSRDRRRPRAHRRPIISIRSSRMTGFARQRERECGSPTAPAVGQIRRPHPCVSISLAMTE